MKAYCLTIRPAIIPAERHKIQDALQLMGYHVSGGGTATDMSSCDISFFRKGGGNVKPKATPKAKVMKKGKKDMPMKPMPKKKKGMK